MALWVGVIRIKVFVNEREGVGKLIGMNELFVPYLYKDLTNERTN